MRKNCLMQCRTRERTIGFFNDALFALLVGMLDYFSQHHELDDNELAIYLLRYFLKTYGSEAGDESVRAIHLMQLQPPNPYVVEGGEYAAFSLNAPKRQTADEFADQSFLFVESIVILLKDEFRNE